MSGDSEKIAPPELVAPAGNLQKLKVALAYGADAVYFSSRRLSLRAKSENFTPEQMEEAIEYVHAREKRAYVLLNVFPHNEHIAELQEELEFLAPLKPDGVVVSDVAAFELAREIAPGVPIHISTQANVTNWRTAEFWERMGASRIILARELSLGEISEIATHIAIGVEIFVHGAMCMAYSGRCFMSKHFVGRDANLGDCAQPCRWNYSIVEEKRPHDVLECEESEDNTLIFSSRDLCTIEHIPTIISAGVKAFKIEGRMKSAYYLGVTTRAYRQALDRYAASPDSYKADPSWIEELRKTSNREFTTGFYLGEMKEGLTPAGGADRITTHAFVGLVVESGAGKAQIEVRGRIRQGDELECTQPNGDDFVYKVSSILDENGAEIEAAHANAVITLPGLTAQPFSFLRRSDA